MTRRAVFLLAALALPMMLIVAMAPASAAPGYGPMKCQPRKPQNTWPGNGHFWSCVSDDANQDYREVFSAANGLPGRPNMAFEVVAKLGVNLIFFYNRKQANELLVQQFRLRAAYTSDTAHCGNTYAADDPRAPIVVAVYYLCNMNGDQLAVNPNLRETTLHELGHAFDIALTRLKGPSAGPPSRSAAFRAEVQADLDHLDQSWKSDPPSQRAHRIPGDQRGVSHPHVRPFPGQRRSRYTEVKVVQVSFLGRAEVQKDPGYPASAQGGRIAGEGRRGVGIEVIGRLLALAAK